MASSSCLKSTWFLHQLGILLWAGRGRVGVGVGAGQVASVAWASASAWRVVRVLESAPHTQRKHTQQSTVSTHWEVEKQK